jgi:hypothetical protein
MVKAKNKTLDMFNQLGTQEKRSVNRLLRGLTEGNLEKAEMGKICRSISRACQSDEKPKKINGYILYYKERYPAVQAELRGEKLGVVAKAVGVEWKKLNADEQAKFNKRAREGT